MLSWIEIYMYTELYLKNIVPSFFIKDIILKMLPIHLFGFLNFLFGHHFTWNLKK